MLVTERPYMVPCVRRESLSRALLVEVQPGSGRAYDLWGGCDGIDGDNQPQRWKERRPSNAFRETPQMGRTLENVEP